jgi:hypothetical protein
LDLKRIIADLMQERDRIGRAIAALEGTNPTRTPKEKNVGIPRATAMKAKKRGTLTPEGRRRLSLAMKKRWAERKKNSS